MATTFLAAMSRNVLIIEAAVGAVIIVLLIAILVLNRRKKKAAVTKPPAEVPNYYADLQQQPGGRPDPFGSFAAVTTVPAGMTTSTSPVVTTPATPSVATSPLAPTPAPAPIEPAANGADLSSAHVAPEPGAVPAWPSTESWSPGSAPQDGSALVEAASPAATATIAPGTSSPVGSPPAGWLPDPGGAPDTLRYWDGNAWTEHFAQRS